jgi:exonuclease V gamma subunit
VDALVEKLEARLHEYHDILDLLRSRATEQEVLDLLDEPTTG